jgi:hypothetical protein
MHLTKHALHDHSPLFFMRPLFLFFPTGRPASIRLHQLQHPPTNNAVDDVCWPVDCMRWWACRMAMLSVLHQLQHLPVVDGVDGASCLLAVGL